MTSHDDNPLSGASLLDLGLEEITAPDEGLDQWADAGRALVDQMAASLREQHEVNERAAPRDEESRRPLTRRPLNERYGYRFEQVEQVEQQPSDEPERGQ